MGTVPPTELLRSREGSECIYKESGIVRAARIRSIKVDDRGFEVELVPMPTPGLNASNEPWTSGSNWEHFSCDAELWTSACSGLVWRIFFDADLVRAVKELGQTFSATESESERFAKLIECINESEVSRFKAQKPPRGKSTL